MYKLKFKKLSKLLKNNKMIADSIGNNLYVIENIDNFLQQALPDDLQNQLKPLNLSGRKLVLATDSASIKAKARFLLPAIKAKLQQQYANQIDTIEIKVIPQSRYVPSVTNKRQARELSPASLESIRSMAADMPDSDLRQALLRLSSRHKKK